jgi:hypothetical protein
MNKYRGAFSPGIKRSERDADHSPLIPRFRHTQQNSSMLHCVTPRSKILLEKLTVRKLLPVHEIESSLLPSQKPTTGPYLEDAHFCSSSTRSSLMFSSHVAMPGNAKRFYQLRKFSGKNCICNSDLPHDYCMSNLRYPHYFYHHYHQQDINIVA